MCVSRTLHDTLQMTVTGLDGFGSHELVVGTAAGEILLSGNTKLNSKSDSAVTQVLCVSRQLALVFYQRANGRHSASAYRPATLEHIQGLSLHDCCGGTVIGRNIMAVFTSAAIRVLKFDVQEDTPKAKLAKTIELKGTICGVSVAPTANRSPTLLVATDSEYKLLSMKTGSITPLFPIVPSVCPQMCTVGSDFLVVQGTGMEDPAMGLFVDIRGEVARQGAILQWNTYPTSIASALSKFVLAVVSHELVVYRIDLENVELLPKLVENVDLVQRLTYSAPLVHDDLLERLGDPKISTIDAECAVVYSDGRIELWNPPTKPLLLDLEHQISNNEISSIEPDPRFTESEQGVAELKYLNEYLILHLLDQNKVTKAVKEWHSCAQLEPELVLYIFTDREHHGSNNYSKPDYFPGLEPLVSSLKAKGGGPHGEEFLIPYLKSKIKALRRNPATAYTSAKQLELVYAHRLSHEELVRFLLERELKSRTELLQWLNDTHQYQILVEYFQLSNNRKQLAELYLKIVKINRADDKALLKEAAGELLKLTEHTDLWETAIVFVGNPHLPMRFLMEIIQSTKFANTYSAAETLEMLKQTTDSGKPWRAYLNYLVHERGLFHDDLATLVVADLIETANRHSTQITESYEKFKQHTPAWPKPTYREWLQHSGPSGYPDSLLALQGELWNLMACGELDWGQLVTTFTAQLSSLKSEITTIYQRLGLHEQALQILCEIGDFRAVIEYCAGTKDAALQRDLAPICLRTMMNANEPMALKELLQSCKPFLQAETVLQTLPSDTPVHAVAEFLAAKVVEARHTERQAYTQLAVAKASCNM